MQEQGIVGEGMQEGGRKKARCVAECVRGRCGGRQVCARSSRHGGSMVWGVRVAGCRRAQERRAGSVAGEMGEVRGSAGRGSRKARSGGGRSGRQRRA